VFNSGFSESTVPTTSTSRSRFRPSTLSELDDDGELSLSEEDSETDSASEGDHVWDEDDDSPVDESEDEEEDEDEPEEAHFQELSPVSPTATSSLNSSNAMATFPAQAPVSPDVSRSSRLSTTPPTSTTPRSRTSSASLTDDETQSFQSQSTASSHLDDPSESELGRLTPPSSNRFVDAASAPSGKGRKATRRDGRAKVEVVITDARCDLLVPFPPRRNELNGPIDPPFSPFSPPTSTNAFSPL
jgi:hypothetical protein